MEELTRWHDDAPEEFGLAKRAHGQLGPDEEQLARMTARMQAAIPSQEAVPGKLPATTAALHTFKRLWLLVALAALGGGGWLLRGVAHERPPVGDHARAHPATPSTLRPPTAAAAPVPAIATPAPAARPAASESAAMQRSGASQRVRGRASGALSVADPVAELAVLERARRVLAADPGRALAITDEHRRSFRPAVFAEERELLAIEALMRLRRSGLAERRARAFSRDHPNSVHVPRLAEILRAEAR